MHGTGKLPLSRPYTVLLAEDEILIRMGIAEEMRLAGWKVLEASNADDAIRLLKSGLAVDLLVTDVNMPGERNGLDLAMFVAREMADIKIAVMSGRTLVMPEVEWIGVFFPKPFLASDLMARLQAFIQDDQTVSGMQSSATP
jgi:DNA-binding response OmpR family regulator